MKFFAIKNKERQQPKKAGCAGEEEARLYLQNQGMKFVARNFSCRWGELDLIMKDGETLVVVEVRMRASAEYGLAAETVNHNKQVKIIKATKLYLQQSGWWGDVRFDVVAFMTGGNKGWQIEHIKDAFGT